MHSPFRVLLASRSKLALKQLISRIEPLTSHRIDTRHIENGHADPLWGLDYVPDIVVLILNDDGHHDLTALREQQSPSRPPIIVLAEHGDATTMRLAMQAGARDFLSGAVRAEEVLDTIERISSQTEKQRVPPSRRLTAFVNAKGGSGATFVASNVAHLLTTVSKKSTALLSLDMQFDSLAQYFDIELRHGLQDVLDSVDELDEVALEAFMTRHQSGLRMLAPRVQNDVESSPGQAARLATLLKRLTAHFEHVVVDMPRRIDKPALSVLRDATRIVLVAQQGVGHMRDAARMLQILEHHGVDREQVIVLVNRFEKNASITLSDVRRALQDVDVIAVPSDYKTVAESIDLGVPMYLHAKSSAVTKALMSLETKLGGVARRAPSGLFGKAISTLLRK